MDAPKIFVIVPPKELLKRLESVHGSPKTYQMYLSVTEKHCWETRSLAHNDMLTQFPDADYFGVL